MDRAMDLAHRDFVHNVLALALTPLGRSALEAKLASTISTGRLIASALAEAYERDSLRCCANRAMAVYHALTEVAQRTTETQPCRGPGCRASSKEKRP